MMNRMMGVMAVAAILAFTGAQQRNDPSDRPYSSEVGVYRLQVRLVDGDGADLSGVVPEDLELLVDGEPRPIVDLMEIDATTLEPANWFGAGEASTDTTADRVSISSRPFGRATPPAARRRFMIFFHLSGRQRRPSPTARTAAGKFVQDLAQTGDLIGMAIYRANRGLQYLVPFTSDRRRVKRALDKLANDSAPALLAGDDAGTLQALIAEESAAFGRDEDKTRSLLVEHLQRVETVITAVSLTDAIKKMSNALADVQGRKQIVLFSRGFPDAAMWDTTVRESLMAAVEAAKQAEVVIHTFHPSRLANANYHDVSRMTGGYPLPGLRVRGPLDAAIFRRVSAVTGNDRDALYYLSGETGGTATFFKHALHSGLKKMERQTRRYFMLAFPVYEADPEAVRIKIRPRDPSIRVLWAPTRLLLEAPGRDPVGRQFQVANALEFGSDVSGLDLSTAVLPQPMSGGFGRFATLLEVPLEQVFALLRSRGDDRVRFEVMGLAITRKGVIADHFRGQIEVDEAAAKLSVSGAPFRYQNLLALPAGEFIIKLLVREAELGLLTSRTYSATVPSVAPHTFVVSAPVIVVADGGSSTVQGAALDRLPEYRRGLPLDNPFAVGDRLLSPRIGRLTLRDQPVDVFVTVENSVPSSPGGRHNLSVDSWIEDAGGRYPVGTAVLGAEKLSKRSVVRLLLRLATPSAARAGSYRLVTQVTDHVAGKSTRSSVSVTVWR